MIYRAYLDGVIFFDSSADYDGLTLTEAEVELEAGGAGSFTFSIPPQNIAYGSFNMLTSIVSVYRDDEEIFYGRVYSISGEFNTIQSIECEGYLAALNDSIVEPFTFNSTISALVLQFIELHNERCPGYPFELGTITVDDDYVYRAYENYETAWSRLSDLVDSYGGYMSTRHSTDEDGNECVYLDWYQEYETEASQSIDFGENLIDLTQESDASEIITCLIPFGAEVTEEDDDGNETTYQVDITSVTDDGRDYVYSEDGIARYGYIWDTKEWEDVTEPSNLLNKAQEYVNSSSQGTVTIKATAVDLANIDEDITHFAIGENIQVTSSPHGIDQTFLCTELKFDLLDPSKDELTLGDEIVGYVTAASKNLKSSLKVVETTVNNYTLNEINEAVDQITTLLQSTYITQDSEAITALAEEIDALNEQIQSLASITLTAEEIELLVSGVDLSTWVTLTESALKIGQSGSDIHSEQDNDSYIFVDSAGNVLLRIQTTGIDATTMNVSEQVSFKSGGVEGEAEWAIRLGAANDSGFHNLNDVYIGD